MSSPCNPASDDAPRVLPVTMLERVVRTPVTIDDLMLAITAVAALSPGEKESLDARTAAVARALAKRGSHAGLLLAAIHVRLATLSRLRTGQEFVDGADVKDLLNATARAPLRVNGDQAWFDEECFWPDSFGSNDTLS